MSLKSIVLHFPVVKGNLPENALFASVITSIWVICLLSRYTVKNRIINLLSKTYINKNYVFLVGLKLCFV